MVGKGFKMIFIVWTHSAEDLHLFLNYMNNIDQTKKIQYTMEIAEDVLEFRDLKLTFDRECGRILLGIFAKATNSFTDILPGTCFPKKYRKRF